VLVCIGSSTSTSTSTRLETGGVDWAAPRGVRDDVEEVAVVLDTERLSRLSQMRSRSQP
jgi:hypothetical protein